MCVLRDLVYGLLLTYRVARVPRSDAVFFFFSESRNTALLLVGISFFTPFLSQNAVHRVHLSQMYYDLLSLLSYL